MFGAEGDTGAFSCIRSDGTTILERARPAVAALGDQRRRYLAGDRQPGHQPAPVLTRRASRRSGTSTACATPAPARTASLASSGAPRPARAAAGSSQYWGRPFYQHGPGSTTPSRHSATARPSARSPRSAQPCREDPDISANADEYTPYAEYCTGNASTPFSVCGTFSGGQTPPGWFGIGGTSLSSPLWSGIIADRDSFQGLRSGNVNPLLYLCTTRAAASTSTTSPAPARPPATTACSRRPPAMTWPPGSARPRWRR